MYLHVQSGVKLIEKLTGVGIRANSCLASAIRWSNQVYVRVFLSLLVGLNNMRSRSPSPMHAPFCDVTKPIARGFCKRHSESNFALYAFVFFRLHSSWHNLGDYGLSCHFTKGVALSQRQRPQMVLDEHWVLRLARRCRCGTPSHMAPEVHGVQSQSVKQRSDKSHRADDPLSRPVAGLGLSSRLFSLPSCGRFS